MKWVLRCVAALIGGVILAVLVLIASSRRADAGKAHAAIVIKTRPERLWPWLEEGDRLKQWISWVVEVRPGEGPAKGVGAVRTLVMKDENNGGMLIPIVTTCTEYAPPERMTVRTATSGMFDGQQAYRLTDLGGGETRIDVDARYHYSIWLAQLMEPLVTPAARKKMERDLAHLKSLVESAAATEAAR